ncbi:MAG: acyl-CoA dehydrogenase [Proteobacteria bacterium]|nr:acyl-CoA dehydrogenase [Pseudomonadota bacterium]
MDFSFSEEQQQLGDTLRRFVARDYTFEKRKGIKDSAGGWSREVWRTLADIGVLAVNVPEEHGGLGYGPVETMLVMNTFGAALLVEPYLSSAVIATTLIGDIGDEKLQAELLPQLAAGDRIAVLAHFEPGSRFETRHVEATARAIGDGYILNGHKAVVLHAGAADALLVSARTSGGADDADGISLFLVPRVTPGMTLREYPTLDGQRAAEVLLREMSLPASARLGDAALVSNSALPAIEQALDIGLAALCAEAIGVMDALIAATVDYLKTRQQFGQPIGRFQALQHRMADMLLYREQARSMSYLAAMRCNSQDLRERRRTLSAAKVTIGQACRFIGQNAVQLHGGMGMSDELNVSHWFKRLAMIELSCGDTDTHLQRFIANR